MKNIRKATAALIAASAMAASSVMAVPNMVISSPTISSGGTANVEMTFQADGTVSGFDFMLTFDDANLTATAACNPTILSGGGNNAAVVCSVVGNTVSVLIVAPVVFPIPTFPAGDISLGFINFASGAAPVGTYPIPVLNDNYFDTAGGAVAGTANTDGVITINAGPVAAYDSTPAPGSTLNFGPALAGSGNLTSALSITNNGDAGSTLTTTCTLSGADAAQFAVDASLSAMIAQGASVNGNVTCNDPGIGNDATFTASLDCAHNGSAPGSPVSYPLSCVYNPPFAQITPTPADGTTRNIFVSGFGASGNTSVTFAEISSDGVDGTVDCVISGADAGLFAVTAPTFPAPVASGGSVQVTVNGTEPGTGLAVAAALDCAIGDGVGGTSNVSFPLGFIVQAQVVPTMSQIGMILMGLFLAGVGFMTLRRKATV